MNRIRKQDVFFSAPHISAQYVPISGVIEEHTHDFFEIAYLVEGRVLHVLNGRQAVLSKGDFVFLSGRASHSYERLKEEEPLPLVLNCLFRPEALFPLLDGENSMEELTAAFQKRFSAPLGGISDGMIFQDEKEEIFRLMEKMEGECSRKHDGYSWMLRAVLEELLMEIFRMIRQGRTGKFYPGREREFAEILYELDHHYLQPVSVKKLAARFHMSEAHLCRNFKKRMGSTILEYVQKKRIERAKALLVGTSLSITEVGYQIGYQDTKFFYQIFRRYIGMAPQQYRREKTRVIDERTEFLIYPKY